MRYAMLDDNPVRFAPGRAWMFVKGGWKQVHSADVTHDARVLTKDQYETIFKHVEKLPRTAL